MPGVAVTLTHPRSELASAEQAHQCMLESERTLQV